MPSSNSSNSSHTVWYHSTKVLVVICILVALVCGAIVSGIYLVTDNDAPTTSLPLTSGSLYNEEDGAIQLGQHRFLRDRIDTFDLEDEQKHVETNIPLLKSSSIEADGADLNITDFVFRRGDTIDLREVVETIQGGVLEGQRLVATNAEGRFVTTLLTQWVTSTTGHLQISAYNTGGIKLDLPQPLQTTSSPRFYRLELDTVLTLY